LFLGIDVGNTNTVIGLFKEKTLQKTWRISTHPICTSDELLIKITALLSLSKIQVEQIEAVVVSSVVPSFTQVLKYTWTSQSLWIIDSTWPFSFQIKAYPPQQVGIDRLVNAEAAVREFNSSCIVIDSGTATTLCAISQLKNEFEYWGGAIVPGIELSSEALVKNTAQLFKVDLSPPPQAIGRNTQDALRSGIVLGYASLIDGMIRRFKKELDQANLPVIATGGIGHIMKGLSEEITHFDSDLTLKGIALLYNSLRHNSIRQETILHDTV
jgi:type III pantothenate kinase